MSEPIIDGGYLLLVIAALLHLLFRAIRTRRYRGTPRTAPPKRRRRVTFEIGYYGLMYELVPDNGGKSVWLPGHKMHRFRDAVNLYGAWATGKPYVGHDE